MRIVSVLILIIACQMSVLANKTDLEEVRSNYIKAVTDKNLCTRLIQHLKSNKDKAVHLAYLGGLQTIWANHVFNPLSKISTFNEGKENIEKAVSNAPYNAEIRFIRYSVQKNAPRFLGYTSNINEDESFLKANRKKITSAAVLKNVDELLKSVK